LRAQTTTELLGSNAGMGHASHWAGLDGVRAVAVCAVIWHHTHPGWGGIPMSQHGFLGVDMFFVLSGFLITSLLAQERERNGSVSLARFYVRRSLRIFPLYYLVLGALTGYFLWAGAASTQGARFLAELPYHATYLSNWVHTESLMDLTWSLATEEQFYLLWPPLLVFLKRHAISFLLLLLIPNQLVNFGLADGALESVGLPYRAHEILHSTFTPIILGCLLALCLRHPACRFLAQGLASPLAIGALLIAWLAIVNVPGGLRGWPRLSFHVVTALLLGAMVLQPQHALTRLLEWRPLAAIGAISYGMYLLHMIVRDPVVRAMQRFELESPLLLFIGCLAGTVALATVSFTLFERPLLRLKERFR
jgi:peptidoglycan/LPS O-acetylase OafA/YrhL